MKIIPEDILNIVNKPHTKPILRGLEWNNFLDWYRKLLMILFKLSTVTFEIHDLENRLCVDLTQDLCYLINVILKETDNKYIKESFYVDMWVGHLIFKPNIEAIKYFDTLVRLYK